MGSLHPGPLDGARPEWAVWEDHAEAAAPHWGQHCLLRMKKWGHSFWVGEVR